MKTIVKQALITLGLIVAFSSISTARSAKQSQINARCVETSEKYLQALSAVDLSFKNYVKAPFAQEPSNGVLTVTYSKKGSAGAESLDIILDNKDCSLIEIDTDLAE